MKKNSKQTKTLRASGANQWARCGAWVKFDGGKNPLEDNEAALLGTLTHRLAESMLLKKHGFEIKTLDEDRIYATKYEEIKNYAEAYVKFVNRERENHKGKHYLFIEQEIKLKIGKIDVTGTLDCGIHSKEKLQIIDLKTGFTEVSAEYNLQLMIYVLGLIQKLKLKASLAELVIFQPSIPVVSRWETTAEEIEELLKKITLESRNKFVTGSHCRGCKFNDVCPEFRKQIDRYMHPKYQDVSLDRAEIWSELLDIANPAIKMFENVKSSAKMAAESGIDIPGYELATKSGHRTWNQGLTEKDIMALGLKEKDAFKIKLESPAGVEKILKSKGKWEKMKEKFEALFYTPPIRYLKRTGE